MGLGFYLGHCQRRLAHLRFFCVTAHTLLNLDLPMVVRLTSTVSEFNFQFISRDNLERDIY